MCGIYGAVGKLEPGAFTRMGQVLNHRGPDDAGQYLDESVSLGHRRLSILDRVGGQQPMTSQDGRFVVVFNGEIYNHPELKKRFEAQGLLYHTRSDTETILHAYAVYGNECVRELDGMFAFVLYDRERRVLFGARDRFGKKPLYVTRIPFGDISFAFASELKSLRECPDIQARLHLSPQALSGYLTHDYVIGQKSIYEGIETIGPGCAFTYGLHGNQVEGLRQWRYWTIPSVGQNSQNVPSFNEACEQVQTLLHRAVERRMLADVPIGVLLSGGLDSSTIASLIAKSNYGPYKTFSIGFEESSFDESEPAAEVARIVGSEHFTRIFTASEFVRQVPLISASLDEPFADPSIYPTAVLCELAAEHVKVAMGGDGADEIFAGYGTFAALKAARWYERLVPGFVHRNLVQPLTRVLPDSDKYLPLSFKIARFLRGTHVPESIRTARWMAPFSPELLRKLTPDLREMPMADEGCTSNANAIDRALEFFQRTYLPNDILVKMDRASMMHSLEVRSPFLDTALVSYVNSLPSDFKFRKGIQKHVLREAVLRAKLLPENIVRRRKQGFAMPVARWMRVELQAYFREVLIDTWPQSLDMFDRKVIQLLWNEHTNRVENRYKELWALFALAQWENFRDRSATGVSKDVLQFTTRTHRLAV